LSAFLRRKEFIACIFLIICLLCLTEIFHGNKASAAPATGPIITLGVTFGPPTTNIKVKGGGFGAEETVILDFDTSQIGTASTNNAGAFSTRITVPASALPGRHTIKATGNVSHLFAKTFFLVRTNWPMSGFDPGQDLFNPYENVLNTNNVSSMIEDWNQPIGGDSSASPIVANGIVYVGSDKFYAFNATTGKTLWSYPIQTGGDAAVANDIVYVGADKLYAFHAKTGKLLWSATVGGTLVSAPVVVNNVVYTGGDAQTLYAFNAATGALDWSAKTGGSMYTAPAVANGIVYVSVQNGVYAYNALNGNLLWTAIPGGDFSSSPAVSQGIVYVISPHGTLYALNATAGTTVWSASILTSFSNTPAVADGIVYVATFNFYAFNAGTGALIWSQTLNDLPNASPTIANGILYLGEGNTSVTFFAFNAATGAMLWYNEPDVDAPYSNMVIVNGMVYVNAYTITGNEDYLYTYHLPPSTL